MMDLLHFLNTTSGILPDIAKLQRVTMPNIKTFQEQVNLLFSYPAIIGQGRTGEPKAALTKMLTAVPLPQSPRAISPSIHSLSPL